MTMGEKIFYPFQENGFENGGQAYGERTLRSGRDTFNERSGHTAAFVLQWDNHDPCPRCGKALLKGQYGRFSRAESDALVHDGCHDPDAPASEHARPYVAHGLRKPPLCGQCWEYHNGECP